MKVRYELGKSGTETFIICRKITLNLIIPGIAEESLNS